jgi:hypothetical protein
MNGLQPNDFTDYHAYETHRDALERAQRTTVRLFDVWNALYDLVDYDTGKWCELRRILDDAVQLGYESALGLSHRTADYLDKWSLSTYSDVCAYCNNSKASYFEGETSCPIEDAGERCQFEMKEFLD